MREFAGNDNRGVCSLPSRPVKMQRDLDDDPGRHYPQAHINCLGRVSQQADGNEVDAGFGVDANIFETDAAGTLEWNAALQFRAALDGAACVFGRHVVEQNCFRATGQRLLQFFKSAYLDLKDLRTSAVVQRALDRGHDSARQRDVIVLNKDSVGEIEPVILSAAAAHRIFVDYAQAGCGLAGVENAGLGAGNGIDELASQSGNAAHALQEIQDYALARENDARVVPDHGD